MKKHVFALLVSASMVMVAVRKAPGEPEPLRSITVDEDTWMFNWSSFDQDKIVSFGRYQYTIYWDADKVLVVVRRDLRSDDHGATWKNDEGIRIANLEKGNPILLDDPGIVVRNNPLYSWLMNQCSMAIDSENQPHVATFHVPLSEIEKRRNVRHGSRPDLRRKQQTYRVSFTKVLKLVSGNFIMEE